MDDRDLIRIETAKAVMSHMLLRMGRDPSELEQKCYEEALRVLTDVCNGKFHATTCA